jgi:hypothetical protein
MLSNVHVPEMVLRPAYANLAVRLHFLQYRRFFMHRSRLAAALAIGTFAFSVSGGAQAQVITDWDFGSLASTNKVSYDPAAATTGTGSASSLGMTNSYTYTNGAGGATLGTGSVTDDDIINDSVNSGGAGTNGSTLGNGNVWRIRGVAGTGTTGTANNGWNISAPQYTQGAEFDTSTVGYNVTQLQFDWAATTQGVGNLQVQYNTNINNAGGWTNVGSVWSATVDNNATGSAGSGFAVDTVSLAGVSGLSNDANFGIRLVSAYNPTLGNEYASATTVLSGTPAEINNNSGNWRIADVQIDGTPVPLPASAWMLLSSIFGVALFARRHKVATAA